MPDITTCKEACAVRELSTERKTYGFYSAKAEKAESYVLWKNKGRK